MAEKKSEVKHGGCYGCGSKDQPVLSARVSKVNPTLSVALCDGCFGGKY